MVSAAEPFIDEQGKRIGVEMLVEIQHLDHQGLNKTQIADRLGIDRKTVRKNSNQNVKFSSQKSGKYRSIIEPYKPYLQYRLSELPELRATRLCLVISALSCLHNYDAGLLYSFPAKVLKEKFTGTLKPSGTGMKECTALLKLFPVLKHR